MTAKVLIADSAAGARFDLVNPAQPPTAVLARELAADDLPAGTILTPILPGTMLGLQIDEPLAALPVPLTGLEVGEIFRWRTNQATSATGAGQTLALAANTTMVTKNGGVSVSFAAFTGGDAGRMILLRHTSGGASTTTLEHDTGGTDGFLCPGSLPFVFGGSTAVGGGTVLPAGFLFYDTVAARWLVFPRGMGRTENVNWTGDHSFGGALLQANTTSGISLTAGTSLSLSSTGSMVFSTNGVERLEIENDGAWQLLGSQGSAGTVMQSQGASASPRWQLVGQANLSGGILASLLSTTPSATDTTNLSVGAITVPANSTVVGYTYVANLSVEFVHTASATPTLTLEWVFGGTVVATRVITVTAVAGTYTLWVEGYFRHTTIGAASNARVSIRAVCTAGATVADQIGETTVALTGTLDTTISRTLELRVRMTTTVASNSITLHQATIQRLINQ